MTNSWDAGDGRLNVVKKASQVVMAKPRGQIDLVDNKTFNYLLLRAYKNLPNRTIHKIPVSEVLDFLRHTSTTRLHESLDNLGKVNVEIDYIDDDGSAHSVTAHYLSFDLSKAENGILQYAFDSILLEFLKEPKVYALVNLDKARHFRSTYGIKLYETMLMYYRRYSPVWRPTVDELRSFFGVENSYDRFDNLRRKVIETAVGEVNEIAEFDVTVEYIRGGRGGKVEEVEFTAVTKSHAQLIAVPDMTARSRTKKDRDPNTVDLLDGRTDLERGAPPALQATTLDDAREMIGQGDVGTYEDEWRREMHGRIVRDPDISFLSWLGARLQKESDALLVDIEDDTFGDIIEQIS